MTTSQDITVEGLEAVRVRVDGQAIDLLVRERGRWVVVPLRMQPVDEKAERAAKEAA